MWRGFIDSDIDNFISKNPDTDMALPLESTFCTIFQGYLDPAARTEARCAYRERATTHTWYMKLKS